MDVEQAVHVCPVGGREQRENLRGEPPPFGRVGPALQLATVAADELARDLRGG
ncbi:hypothetical protein [Frankia sp. Cj3]|uniref:hypothetical protein n=1 Tax=Frankia sp. Cj3 TaxID=2880976 RepID=UPI001EF694F3|nr:hypothetical protein [Frankia sp. Cj3]